MKVFCSKKFKAFLQKEKCFLVDLDKLEKKCSAMETRLFKETEYLIIGDKVGDIMAFDLPKLLKKTFLIGHCATVITGLVNVGDYLASSDRDEKVFICHFPQTFNIQSICVGHKQYISAMITVNDRIVTGSADGTLRLWNITEGQTVMEWYLDEILKVESEEETVLIPSQLISLQDSLFAGIVDESKKVFVLDAAKPECVRSVELPSCPVVMTMEAGELMALCADMKLYKIHVKEETLEAEEVHLGFIDELTRMGYVYEKSVDEEESGELFKRIVKKRHPTSGGLEKQFEHDKRVYKSG
ncbi:WD40 repeat-containing protein [Blastocystis sp. ATCC 50177/Nand II]|uniref:WD40 repeat-containing protein n=1 Tax=Blastocystis sp. subtype 1 (strain ATCC 50177 / NandII) TaxID=478820 RepID=A0A196SHB2_BLAHN|nr:WD40 repeat-containing protein [Blastocystis sp. ATCC 50177/Nand II]